MKPDKIFISLTLIIILALFSWISSCTHVANISNMPEVCFTGEIVPVFSANCAISGCHNGGGGEEGMNLADKSEILKGVAPGNPGASRLYQAIISKWGNMMPPGKPLSLENREKIRIWIEQGANPTVCTDTTGPVTGSYVARACFTRDILPVIVSRCATAGCHDVVTHEEGYIFTSYTGIIRTVSAGSLTKSKLYQVINLSSGEEKMPPANKPQLSAAEIDSIGKWISYGALNENCGEVCDTINPVTFSGTIWPIMQASCTGCHSGTTPSGNVLLASYNNVATVASSGLLLKSLNGTGVTKMPVGTSFSACRIRQFQIWINNGYKNN